MAGPLSERIGRELQVFGRSNNDGNLGAPGPKNEHMHGNLIHAFNHTSVYFQAQDNQEVGP